MHKVAHYIACSDSNNIYGTAFASDKSLLVGNRRQLARIFRDSSGAVENFGKVRGGKQRGVALAQVPLTNIPDDADIISIHALPNGPICVAYHQPSLVAGRPSKYALNIYGSKTCSPYYLDHSVELDWDILVEDCQCVELSFIPFQLSHTKSFLPHSRRPVVIILLAADDGQVYAFGPNKNIERNGRVEAISIERVLPELTKLSLPTIIMSFDVFHTSTKRYVAAGYQNGEVLLMVTGVLGEPRSDGPSPAEPPRSESAVGDSTVFRPSFGGTLSRYRQHLDGAIPSVRLFVDDRGVVNLVVCGALGYALVYNDVERNGLNVAQTLPGSTEYDAVLCSNVIDFRCTGGKDLVIGTYSGEILLYSKSDRNDSGGGSGASAPYGLYWQKRLADPVFAVSSADLDMDGVDELLATTAKGVHIIQADIEKAAETARGVLKVLSGEQRDDAYKAMLEQIKASMLVSLKEGKPRAPSGVPGNRSIAWMLR
jgi:hypothetical protein